MCIAIPGNIVAITGEDELTKAASVDFGGVRRMINLAFVPEAKVNDWVLVHAGFAISLIDEKEAKRVFEDLNAISNAASENSKS